MRINKKKLHKKIKMFNTKVESNPFYVSKIPLEERFNVDNFSAFVVTKEKPKKRRITKKILPLSHEDIKLSEKKAA